MVSTGEASARKAAAEGHNLRLVFKREIYSLSTIHGEHYEEFGSMLNKKKMSGKRKEEKIFL